MKDSEAKAFGIETSVEAHRRARGECPTHGVMLVLAPTEHVSSPRRKKCPEFGCAYTRVIDG